MILNDYGKKIFTGFILLVAFNYFFFCYCFKDEKNEQVLIVAKNAETTSLDPGDQWDTYSSQVLVNIYESLVKSKEGGTGIEPSLAESWSMSSDGMEWVFQLRQGVRFHDGCILNAEAVVFSFERQMDINYPHRFGQFKAFHTLFNFLEKIEAIGPYEVKFVLSKPYAPFLANLSQVQASIVSPEAVKKWRYDFAKHPVGSGAFQFQEWNDDRIVLKANQSYWRGAPHLSTVIYKCIPDKSLRMSQLKAKNVDIVYHAKADDLIQFRRDTNFVIYEQPSVQVSYIALNNRKPPFDNVIVRRAINYLVHKKPLVQLVYQETAIPAKGPLPPLIWGYNEQIEDYPYDPVQAKALLKIAGLERGFKVSIFISEGIPDNKEIALALQGNLKEANIGLEIHILRWRDLLAKVNNAEHDMVLISWTGDNGDPDNYFYTLLDKDNAIPGGMNRAYYESEDMHRILLKAQRSFNQQERILLYRDAQELFHKDIPWIPLSHRKEIFIVNKRVQGFQIEPNLFNSFNFYKIRVFQ